MSHAILAIVALTAGLIGLVGLAPAQRSAAAAEPLQVPADFATIQEAVDVAEPGDVILISPGRYREAVEVRTDGITIRGLDRNRVVVDGEYEREIGILVDEASEVAVENLTVCCHVDKGVVWTGVSGWSGRYLTAYNNGAYGLWAIASSGPGSWEHVYASGHHDTGLYVGQCERCDATIVDSLAERNAAGYSGANTVGVNIFRSEFRRNAMGMVPNSLRTGKPPTSEVLIEENRIHDNGRTDVPGEGFGQYHGFGIALIGTAGVEVVNNVIARNGFYGVAVVGYQDGDSSPPPWRPEGTRILGNVVGPGHSVADLLLGAPAGDGNCFEDNRRDGGDPPGELPGDLQDSGRWSCSNPSTPPGAERAEAAFWERVDGPSRVDYAKMPAPPPQAQMLGESPGEPRSRDASRLRWLGPLVAVMGGVAGFLIALRYPRWRGRRRGPSAE